MKNTTRIPTDEETDLSRFNLFKTLASQELNQLYLSATCRIYEKKDIVYTEYTRLSGFYFISKGILKLFKTGRNGKEQIIRFVKSGDIIGYRSLITREPACSTAKVLEEAVIYHISYNEFLIMVQNNWKFAECILQIACQELCEANKFLTSIAQLKLKENLAEVLLWLKQNFDPDQTNVLQIPLSREDLSDITGAAKESVTRLLSELKREKIIELKGNRIKLLNIPKLQRIAKHYNMKQKN